LQERKIGKNKFKVHAPIAGDITTDDLADVLAVASYMAVKSEVEGSNFQMIGISNGKTIGSSRTAGKGIQSYRRKLFMHKSRDKAGSFIRKRTW